MLNEENDTDKDVGNNREKRRKGNKQHNRALSLERRDVDEASIEEFQIVAEDKEDLNTNYQSIETQKQSPRRKKQTRYPISDSDCSRFQARTASGSMMTPNRKNKPYKRARKNLEIPRGKTPQSQGPMKLLKCQSALMI